MTEETLALIRFAAWGGEAPRITDPETAAREMSVQAVSSLIGTENRLNNIDMPEKLRSEWQMRIFAQMRNYAVVIHAQDELTKILEPYGITPVILKGASAGIYYPDPAFRTYGDIDFLVRGAQPEEARDILIRNGYVWDSHQEAMGDKAYRRHFNLQKDGVHLELHSYFSNRYTENDEKLDEYLEQAGIIRDTIGGSAFYRFADMTNGLVLLEHIHHHLVSDGIGFRQILDFMFFAERCLADGENAASFLETASLFGLDTLAVCTAAMCGEYLGLEKNHEFTGKADPETVHILFTEISESGNFGRKRDKNTKRVAGFLKSENVFARLQTGGLARWKAAENHRCLRPFAWIYQIFYISGVVLKEKNFKRTFDSGRQLMEQKSVLLEKLGL